MQAMDDLRQTIARLRGPGGCPWDQEQTHASLTRCLIDECSELLDTIDRLDMPHMREELGDVLIQVVFHAQLAEEAGHFTLADVAREVNEKLIRRHPHVFGDNKLETTEQVLVKWEQIKAQEKAAKGQAGAEPLFKPQPPRLPALMFADAVLKQIQKKNLPAEEAVDSGAVARLAADLGEGELGRHLFELVAAARMKGLDAESALRLHSAKVMAHVEKNVGARTSS
jgi:MazG family protein